MAQRTIDAPGDGNEAYVTSQQAADYLGIGVDTFLRVVAAERGWLRPVLIGRLKRWDWMAIVALGVLLKCRPQTPGRKNSGKNSDSAQGRPRPPKAAQGRPSGQEPDG